MKQLFSLPFLFAFVLLAFSSCNQTVQRSPQLDSFDQVVFVGPGEVIVVQSDRSQVEIIGRSSVVYDIEAEVRGGILYLGAKHPLKKEEQIKYVITVKDLHSLSSTGSAIIRNSEALKSDELSLALKGAGRMELTIEANSLSSTISGGGLMVLYGHVEKLTLSMTGAGRYDGIGLESREADINISGSAIAWLNVKDRLTAKVAGRGQVTYTGSPNLDKTVTGTGKIEKSI